jgi:hypothetical protein
MNRDSTTTVEPDREKGLVNENFEAGPYTGEIVVSQEALDQWNGMSIEEKTKFERKLLWKLDFRLVPWLSLLYLLSFLDRTNIGNAKLQGVKADD